MSLSADLVKAKSNLRPAIFSRNVGFIFCTTSSD